MIQKEVWYFFSVYSLKMTELDVYGLVWDCGNSIANAMELPQFHAKQSAQAMLDTSTQSV